MTNQNTRLWGCQLNAGDSPDFCKEADEKLCFDICAGQGKEESLAFIREAYKKFKEQPLMDLCGHKSIKEYTKYVPEPIEYYVENGFDYSKVGGIFQSKVALAYNYMLARYKLRYQPIVNGSKFNYLFVKPNNRNNIRAIAFIGNWPAEFNEHFEIDYEEMFRKAFMPVIESMFIIKGWIKEKEKIEIERSGLYDFFV